MIVVYSVRDRLSYRSIDEHMKNIDKYCKKENVLKFLVGHDCDLEEDRRVTYEDLLEKTEEYGVKGFEMSTKPGFTSTIDELFKEVIE